jgi:hypothetical protein
MTDSKEAEKEVDSVVPESLRNPYPDTVASGSDYTLGNLRRYLADRAYKRSRQVVPDTAHMVIVGRRPGRVDPAAHLGAAEREDDSSAPTVVQSNTRPPLPEKDLGGYLYSGAADRLLLVALTYQQFADLLAVIPEAERAVLLARFGHLQLPASRVRKSGPCSSAEPETLAETEMKPEQDAT